MFGSRVCLVSASTSSMCTSDSMLTSANQYLRPEYLPPVSSPLDANKSPLALLAKTCSSIGVDTPSVKSLTGSSSNSSSSSTNSTNERRTTPKSKSADSNDASKLNFKPYELSSKNKSLESEKNSTDKATLASNSMLRAANRSSPGASQNSPDLQKQQATNSASSAPLSYTSLGLPDMHKDSLAAFYKAYGVLSPNCCPTTPGSPYASLMLPPMTLDKTGAYPSIYPPTPSATAAAALAAYNYNYARVKGAMPMVPAVSNPLCRDPYCAGQCGQYGPMHNSHAALLAASQASLAMREAAGSVANQTSCTPATCPNGCSQCEHRYLAAIAAYGNSFSGLPYPPQLSASYASSLAAAAALHHRTAANVGNVCNWVVGETHCGKRFATSEELLQHLKSHTASSQTSAESRTSPPTSTAPTAHLSNSNSPAVSAAQHHSTSGTHSPQSQSTRHSTSSTAVSPNPGSHSLSQLHNNRYHPYSKPVTSAASNLPPSALAGAVFPLSANGAASSPSYPHPFGLSPATSLPSFAASTMYYPYMAPGLYPGRIGPPVPP